VVYNLHQDFYKPQSAVPWGFSFSFISVVQLFVSYSVLLVMCRDVHLMLIVPRSHPISCGGTAERCPVRVDPLLQ